MKNLLRILFLCLFAFGVHAADAPVAAAESNSHDAEKSVFDGVWEGEMRYQFEPPNRTLFMGKAHALRVKIKNAEAYVYVKSDEHPDWIELDGRVRAYSYDEHSIWISIYRKGGVWTEQYSILLSLDGADAAHTVLTRAVTNLGEQFAAADKFFADYREGTLKRTSP